MSDAGGVRGGDPEGLPYARNGRGVSLARRGERRASSGERYPFFFSNSCMNWTRASAPSCGNAL